MANAETIGTDDIAAEEVVQWRYDRLLCSGMPPVDALSVAGNLQIDLHAATDLLERGCPPKTALQILL